MEEKRVAERLEEIPSRRLPEVLQLASELYAKDQAAGERAQERQELLQAASEAGLPPEYLERAAAQLQAQQAGQRPERCPRRPDRRFMLWIGIALLFTIRAAHRVTVPPPAMMPAL